MLERIKNRTIEIFHKYSLPRWFVLFVDISAVFLTFIFAYLLRYNFESSTFEWSLAFSHAGIVSIVYLFFMIIFKAYSGLIRQTTIRDTFLIAITNTAALAVLTLLTIVSRELLLGKLSDIPISILMIHFVTVTVTLLFFRVTIKMFYVFVSAPSDRRKNVLVYGAGETGIMVKKVIQSDPKNGFHLKGFIDDNIRLQGKKVDGYPVYSNTKITKEFVEEEGISVFIFAINNIPAARKKEMLESVIDLGLEILDTPAIEQWLNGNLHVKQLRKVQLEDLLGRDQITLDMKRIGEGLKNKTILVTGAAGSIGSEIVRQLIRYDYKLLLLVDQAETPSFYLENELRQKFPGSRFKLIIGDVTNSRKMEFVFRKYKPEVVFHAAAYKHVPIMEKNPHEAFRVNVGGTKNISDLAIKYRSEKFVMISSDKAVNPTNVMGASKKVCELLVHAQAGRPGIYTKFITTRFGNVLGSNGSVIPLFKKQISEGGPVTITDPNIERFFMTIPEACQLVLEAGFMGNGGEIFIFDMGKPIKILDVAIKLIQLSGLIPYEDIEIRYTGLRPGEKLYEELFADGEEQLATHNPKISIAKVADADYEYLLPRINEILLNIYTMSGSELVVAMAQIVPGYTSKIESVIA